MNFSALFIRRPVMTSLIMGGILLFAVQTTVCQKVLGFLAIALAAFNVVGGFAITDRMLRMFHRRHE